MKLEGINEAITGWRGLVKRLLCLAGLSILALLIIASAALAQINPVEDPGDNVDPETGQVVGDDTPDCERPEDILESGLCRPPEPAPSGADGTITCEDLVDQGQAQEALNRGVNGDPAYDPNVLDEDGDGLACEGLPTATDPNSTTYTCGNFFDQGRAQAHFDSVVRGNPAQDPSLLDEDGDGIACEDLPTVFNPDGTYTCEDFVDQGQAQEFFDEVVTNLPRGNTGALDEDGDGTACEDLPTATDPNASASETTTGEETAADGETPGAGTGGEETGGGAAETTDGNGGTPTDQNGETTGANEGGSGDGSGTAKGDGESGGGAPGPVGDAFGNISRGSLPDTGGGWAVLLLAGAVLIGAGWFLVRRFSASR